MKIDENEVEAFEGERVQKGNPKILIIGVLPGLLLIIAVLLAL